jgi:hypothetical protein
VIATRWVTPPAWPRWQDEPAGLQAAPAPASARVRASTTLIQLARESMRRGHAKVATQRSLMLQESGESLPEDLRAFCTHTWQRLNEAERRRMRAAAIAWAEMVQRRFR